MNPATEVPTIWLLAEAVITKPGGDYYKSHYYGSGYLFGDGGSYGDGDGDAFGDGCDGCGDSGGDGFFWGLE